MDLFAEKVKQNRRLLRGSGRNVLVRCSRSRGQEVLGFLERYTASIAVLDLCAGAAGGLFRAPGAETGQGEPGALQGASGLMHDVDGLSQDIRDLPPSISDLSKGIAILPQSAERLPLGISDLPSDTSGLSKGIPILPQSLLDLPTAYLHDGSPLDELERFLLPEANHRPECQWSALTQPVDEIAFLAVLEAEAEAFLVNDAMLRQIPPPFRLDGVYFGAIRCYPLYVSANTAWAGSSAQAVAIVTDWFFGYGDAVMLFGLLQQFIDKQRLDGREVHLITRSQTAAFFGEVLRDCRITAMLDSFYMYEAIARSSQYAETRFIPSRLSQPPLRHLAEIASTVLDLPQPPIFAKPDMRSLPPLGQEGQRLLSELRAAGKPLIGVQFQTGDAARSWPRAQAQAFLELCLEAGYQPVHLVPPPLGMEGVAEAGFLPVAQLFAFINEMTAVTAIDSVCGHIAGVLGIPNLTVWGRNSPGIQKPAPDSVSYVSFRAVTMNYSIAAGNLRSDAVLPSLVFLRLQELLSGKLVLKPGFITSAETEHNLHCEWVGTAQTKETHSS